MGVLCFLFPALALAYDAIAAMRPTTSTTLALNGSITLTLNSGNVDISVMVIGLAPNMSHGLHIHTFGTYSASGSSAGPHYNPTNQSHACPPSTRHVGDLGNFVTDAMGACSTMITIPQSELSLDSVIGRAIIIHAMLDDCVTQPTGNSSSRIGQGVFGISNSYTQNVAATENHGNAKFYSTSLSTGISGIVDIFTLAGMTYVQGSITGLSPNSVHGFHLHQFGDMVLGPTGSSAGTHFNPNSVAHNCLPGLGHAGDFGNITADGSGVAMVNFAVNSTQLKAYQGIGRLFVVHNSSDNCFQTNSAGTRIAWGVTGLAVEAGPTTSPTMAPSTSSPSSMSPSTSPTTMMPSASPTTMRPTMMPTNGESSASSLVVVCSLLASIVSVLLI